MAPRKYKNVKFCDALKDDGDICRRFGFSVFRGEEGGQTIYRRFCPDHAPRAQNGMPVQTWLGEFKPEREWKGAKR